MFYVLLAIAWRLGLVVLIAASAVEAFGWLHGLAIAAAVTLLTPTAAVTVRRQ